MGIILSRIRKKKSTVEILEKLENDIKEFEENRVNAQKKYKKITKLLLVYSVALYLLCGVVFYFQYKSTLQEKLLYLVPLAISPLLLYIVKRIISWYFVRLINKNQKRLNEIKKEKKRILDEVMDTETYKVAKQILEKFSNENAPKPNVNMQMQVAPVRNLNDGLRKRIVNAPSLPKVQATGSMLANYGGMRTPAPAIPMPANRALQAPVNVMAHLPAPILPLNRGYVDRVVEYLIGDGPNNRYALICSKCHSHNGMALKEEFEYLGFKCCYCFNYNPARKIRPEAPKLESPLTLRRQSESDSDSKTSEENSDAEPKPQIEFGNEYSQLETSMKNGGEVTEKCDETTAREEESGSNAITSPENDEEENEKENEMEEEEKEKEKENEMEEEEKEKREKTAENVIETQNKSNQSDNDANCDQPKS